MRISKSNKSNRKASNSNETLMFENLETRNLLASIIWDNPNPAANGFDQYYGADAGKATQIVEHAIDSWEDYIDDFNYQNVGTPGNAPQANTYHVTISAAPQSAGVLGRMFNPLVDQQNKPYESTIELDDNGIGAQWYFDPNVLTDTEFTQIVSPFSAFALNTDFNTKYDFYTTVLHELGHSMGFFSHFADPLEQELMHFDPDPGFRRLISDNTLIALTTNAGFNYDYTLSSPVATDNLHVHVHGGDLVIRGGIGDFDDIVTVGGNFNETVVTVNGFTERVATTDYNNINVKTWAGDDTATLNQTFFEQLTTDFDLGHGEDRLIHVAVNNGSYDSYVKDDYVYSIFNQVGPGVYGRNYFSNVETVQMDGTPFADRFKVHTNDAAVVEIFAKNGADSIFGQGSQTPMKAWGNGGNDTFDGTDMIDFIYGGNGDDLIRGWKGNDNLYGQGGNDTIYGQHNNDFIRGGTGDDFLNGNAGNDTIWGDSGFDRVIYTAAGGNDFVTATVNSDGDIVAQRNDGSFTGSYLGADKFRVDANDYMWIRGVGGDDNFKVLASVGDVVNGTIDGGAGTDTVTAKPDSWVTVNTEL